VNVDVVQDGAVVGVLHVRVAEVRVQGRGQHNVLRPRIIHYGTVNEGLGFNFIPGKV